LKNSRVPHAGIIIENIFVLRSGNEVEVEPRRIPESKGKVRKSQDYGVKPNLQVKPKLSPSISISIVWSLDFAMASTEWLGVFFMVGLTIG